MSGASRTGSGRERITGLILAGGQGSRLGGEDKGLVLLAQRPMITHVLDALAPQVAQVMINANRNLDAYAGFGCRVVPDATNDYPGPLAGMAAGLGVVETPWLLSVPCDSPLLPGDLAERLYRAAVDQDAEIAIPTDGERAHPVFALMRAGLKASLSAFLAGDERKILRWMGRHRLMEVDFADQPEGFLNVNTVSEVAAVEARLAGRAADRETCR